MSVLPANVNSDSLAFLVYKPGDGRAYHQAATQRSQAAQHSVAQPIKAQGLGEAVADQVLGKVPGVSNDVSPQVVEAEVAAKHAEISTHMVDQFA